MPEHQHKYRFGAPGGGWPTFDKDGKVIREQPEEPERSDGEQES